jgi:hypothetical protein
MQYFEAREVMAYNLPENMMSPADHLMSTSVDSRLSRAADGQAGPAVQ